MHVAPLGDPPFLKALNCLLGWVTYFHLEWMSSLAMTKFMCVRWRRKGKLKPYFTCIFHVNKKERETSFVCLADNSERKGRCALVSGRYCSVLRIPHWQLLRHSMYKPLRKLMVCLGSCSGLLTFPCLLRVSFILEVTITRQFFSLRNSNYCLFFQHFPFLAWRFLKRDPYTNSSAGAC